MNVFMEPLRLEGSKLVPFGGGKNVANASPAELTSSTAVMVLETHNMPSGDAAPWIALLPESERKLNCVINIIDYRAVNEKKIAPRPQLPYFTKILTDSV